METNTLLMRGLYSEGLQFLGLQSGGLKPPANDFDPVYGNPCSWKAGALAWGGYSQGVYNRKAYSLGSYRLGGNILGA